MSGTVRAGNLPRRQQGRGRVLSHIVLFFLVGALLLGAGLYGRQALAERTQVQRVTARIDALLAESMEEVEMAMLSIDPDAASAISRGFSTRRRLLRNTVIQMVQEGQDDHSIVTLAVDILEEGVLNQLEDLALKEEIQAAMVPLRDNLALSIEDQVADAVENMTMAKARVTLPVTTPQYPLMYYHLALIAAGGFFLTFSAALLYAWRKWDTRKRARVGELLEPLDYLLPFFVGIAVFTLYPIVRVVIMSFQERYKLEGSYTGWGLGNYQYVLQGIPGTTNYFLQGLTNTLLYVLYTVPIATALAILFAYLLNQKLHMSALFQTTYFLPMVTSVTAVGLVWRWIFNRDFGVLNAILSLFGVGRIDWLQQASHSLTVLIVFGIWSSLPFTIILLLSGLQNIDEGFYTVARVDGARQWRIFRRITLPLLAPTIGLVLIINSISAFKVFTEVKVLFNGNPGPVLNMYTVVYYIYDMMYEKRELGRAAAAAIILFLFILAFTFMQRYIQRKWKYD